MHNKYKKTHQSPQLGERARRQVAIEAARRLLKSVGDVDDLGKRLVEATEAEFYAAKRKAAAVLGHPVRPGDLPSDAEVREHALALVAEPEIDEDTPAAAPED